MNGSPVIEHRRNVPDLLRPNPLDDTQGEVVVLAALESLPDSTDLTHEARAIHAEVADQVVGTEQIRVPIGLEIRVEPLRTLVDLVLVAVDDGAVRVLVELFDDTVERVGRQLVV